MENSIRILISGGRVAHGRRLSAEQRSLVGGHWSAIEHFLATGDDRRLRDVRDELVSRSATRRAEIGGVELEFDLDVIENYAASMDDRFETIYDDSEVW